MGSSWISPERRKAVIIEVMEQVHISEAELAQDISSVLDRVQSGTEIVIERNAQPVAVLRAAAPRRHKLSEIVAALAPDSTAKVDPDFASDVKDFVSRHRESLHPPELD